MDSEILDQLTNLEAKVDSEVKTIKTKKGRKKKTETLPTINGEEMNDIQDKRNRLIACVVSGNSKQYLGREYTEQQINEMDGNDVNILSNRYESYLSGMMTKSLGKSIINLYSNIACGMLGVGKQEDLSNDLENDPFLNTALQRFTCDMYYHFGGMLAPVSVAMITGRHYAKNSSSILNGTTNSNSKSAENSNKAEEPYKS